MGALAGSPSDPDEMAACSHLLRHLTQIAGRCGLMARVESVMMDS